jgi:hypothetical protein
MCLSRPSTPKPVVQAQPAPTTSSTSSSPEFDTAMNSVETQSDVNMKKKKGKDKLKIANKSDPSLSVTGSTGSGVNVG